MIDQIAWKIWRRVGLDRDEMRGWAQLGLVEAWVRYRDGEMRASFRAYAGWWMKIRVWEAIRNGHCGGMRVLREKGGIKQTFREVGVDAVVGLGREDGQFGQVDDVVSVDWVVKKLDGRTAGLLEGMRRGVPLTDVAREERCSVARVCQRRAVAVEAARCVVVRKETIDQMLDRLAAERRARRQRWVPRKPVDVS